MVPSMPTVEANARTALHLVATEGLTGRCFRVGEEAGSGLDGQPA
jgi:hypothetical protein